ncbi:MAG: hypothetical protein F6K21_27080 [Symploca sp. SIO2D2]|nr:hypothetical protein [Symploca sp. SIO2D2]
MEQASSLYVRKLRLYKSTEQDEAIASYVPGNFWVRVVHAQTLISLNFRFQYLLWNWHPKFFVQTNANSIDYIFWEEGLG